MRKFERLPKNERKAVEAAWSNVVMTLSEYGYKVKVTKPEANAVVDAITEFLVKSNHIELHSNAG